MKKIQNLIAKINREDTDIDFEHFTPHSLQHTSVTNGIAVEMEPKTLQKLLGHNSLQRTRDFYFHVLDDTIWEEMSAFVERVYHGCYI